jgi:hypothetical protein
MIAAADTPRPHTRLREPRCASDTTASGLHIPKPAAKFLAGATFCGCRNLSAMIQLYKKTAGFRLSAGNNREARFHSRASFIFVVPRQPKFLAGAAPLSAATRKALARDARCKDRTRSISRAAAIFLPRVSNPKGDPRQIHNQCPNPRPTHRRQHDREREGDYP